MQLLFLNLNSNRGNFGDPHGRAGDQRRICESWHMCVTIIYN